jgi:hypothetical protein
LAEILYLLSHHFEKARQNQQYKEFKIPNHVAGTSVDSAAYSLPFPYYYPIL